MLLLMIRSIQWHWLEVPWWHATPPPPSFHKGPNISETIHIPTPKPYIYILVTSNDTDRASPWSMPQPLQFLYYIIDLKPFRTPPLNHIIIGPYDMTHSLTFTRGPFGVYLTTSLHKRPNISETVQTPTSKPYILLLIRHIQWHQPRVPWRYAPLTWVHIRLNILETIQNPTPKPYILLFLMIRHIHWHWPGVPLGYATPLPFHIRLDIWETVQIPPLNHIYCRSLW